GPSDAVALLQDRTTAARVGRPPHGAELADLRRVVDRLDGLPLAIELAAARLRVLSAGQLAERLDDVLGALDAGREEVPQTASTDGQRWVGNQEDTIDLAAAAVGGT